MRRGTVYYRDIPAGTLEKDASGYVFRYDAAYLRIDAHDLFTRLLETSAYGAIGAVYVTP